MEEKYNEELEKNNRYENSKEERHSNTHIIILKNMQILQENLKIKKKKLSEINTSKEETKKSIKEQIGVKEIIDIKIKTNPVKK